MARTNYSFEKRQRDLAKKKKQEEKRLKKLNKSAGTDESDTSGEEITDEIETDEEDSSESESDGEPGAEKI